MLHASDDQVCDDLNKIMNQRLYLSISYSNGTDVHGMIITEISPRSLEVSSTRKGVHDYVLVGDGCR